MSNPTSDEYTAVAALRDLVRQFVDERNWQQFHTPKNLAMALAIEAAELMEHFQWLTPEEAQAAVSNMEKRQAIGEELADVICYALALANTFEFDLAAILREKMEKNRRKYPVQQYRGRFGPEDTRPPEV